MNFLSAYGGDADEPSLTTLPNVNDLSRRDQAASAASSTAANSSVVLAPPVQAAEVCSVCSSSVAPLAAVARAHAHKMSLCAHSHSYSPCVLFHMNANDAHSRHKRRRTTNEQTKPADFVVLAASTQRNAIHATVAAHAALLEPESGRVERQHQGRRAVGASIGRAAPVASRRVDRRRKKHFDRCVCAALFVCCCWFRATCRRASSLQRTRRACLCCVCSFCRFIIII